MRARDAGLAADAYYDLGVTLVERGDLEGARDAFFDAIALAPGDRTAQFNLEWTLRALASLEAGGSGEDRERDDPSRPGREGEVAPESPPDDTEPGEREAEAPGQPSAELPQPTERPRENPVQLDPEAARRWLESVGDDPARALHSAAQARGGKDAARRGAGPRW